MTTDEKAPPDKQPTLLEIALAQNAELIRENSELRGKLFAMDAQMRRLLRRIAFPASETLIHDPGQQAIAEIDAVVKQLREEGASAGAEAAVVAATTPSDPADRPVSTTEAKKPPGRRGRGRKTLPDHLQVVEERVTIPAEKLVDTDGTLLVPVGTERSSRLDWEPGHFYEHVTIRVRYGRMDSRQPVMTASVPPAIVERGLGGDNLVLHIAHQKYGQGVPLYRQRLDWLRQGVDLTTQTACSWMGHLSKRIAPVVGAIRQQIVNEPVLHVDDTPIKRWRRGKKGTCHLARFWCYTAGDQVFYDYTDSREGHWPQDLLRGYRGIVVADAYGGHDGLFVDSGGTATEAGCWAHARRPFHELLDRSMDAREQLLLIQALYRIDDVAQIIAEAQERNVVDERGRLRASQAPKLLAAIRERADAIITKEPEQSGLAEGARYLRNHWEALCRFLTDGRIPLDNNAAERQQRPIAIGRKNWLFVASEDGGTWAADLLSVFQSCRLQHIDSIAYLTSIMPRLIAGDTDPMLLTPLAYAASRRQAG